MDNSQHERGDFRKKARGFLTGLLMGVWAMLLVVVGWALRGRLGPVGK